MKTMGKVGLCTVKVIQVENFRPNFLDTNDKIFAKYFPNMDSPCGGVGFNQVAKTSSAWHRKR